VTRSPRPLVLFAAMLLSLPLAGSLAAGAGTSASVGGALAEHSSVFGPPSALEAPWAARMGCDAARASLVPGSAAATGTVLVHLTLAPRSNELYRTPSPGAPALS